MDVSRRLRYGLGKSRAPRVCRPPARWCGAGGGRRRLRHRSSLPLLPGPRCSGHRRLCPPKTLSAEDSVRRKTLSAEDSVGHSPLVRRLLWNLLPLVVVVVALWSTLWGREGLLARHEVKQQLYALQDQVAHLEDDNARMAARIRQLREDPDAVRRAAARQLLLVEPGTTVYRFE
ncbi:MAG: septum formation initiator family protein [Deltaproteobacteria bacterium]|nr:MAG: septum formation initiator family protein [Deltaproteobacteria bacterium]